ncbi:MAG: hypothetical protein AB9M53_00410 [Leptothrix sp. (in: b-proteobacteria)]
MVCANLGWTWVDAEQQLDLHRLRAFTRQWRNHPPVHHLVASYLGYEPPKAAVAGTAEPDGELATVLAQTPTRAAPALNDSAWQTLTGPTETTHV